MQARLSEWKLQPMLRLVNDAKRQPESLDAAGIFEHFFLEMAAKWRVWCSLELWPCQLTSASWVFGLLLGFCVAANAQVQMPEAGLPSPEVAKRLKTLESELRCLVCQNQTLAESPAGLAGDLRREVRSLVEQGKSDAEIKAFLRARYGDFVLYKPPVDPKTYLLWFGPFGLLLIGGVSGWLVARRRGLAVKTAAKTGEVSPVLEASQQRARALLDDSAADKDGKK